MKESCVLPLTSYSNPSSCICFLLHHLPRQYRTRHAIGRLSTLVQYCVLYEEVPGVIQVEIITNGLAVSVVLPVHRSWTAREFLRYSIFAQQRGWRNRKSVWNLLIHWNSRNDIHCLTFELSDLHYEFLLNFGFWRILILKCNMT